jgi:competence protein ComEC
VSRLDIAPLAGLAALIVGVLGAEHTAVAPARATLLLPVGVAALVGAWFVLGPARAILAAVALASLGLGLMTRALDGQRNSPLSGAIDARHEVTLDGMVTSDPSGPPFVVSALARVDLKGRRQRVLLITAGGDAASRVRPLQAGDRVTLTGRLRPLRDGAFDDRARWRHAVARLDAVHLAALAPPSGLYALADGLRNVVTRGTRVLAPTDRALVGGFLLGDTRAVPGDVADDYRDAGLSHLLVVSGGNVAFVLALVGPVLRRLPLGGRTLLALVVVLVFATMTRFEPSVLRASVMAAVALLATLAGRPASRVRVLAYAVIVLLLVDPFLVHSVGFLLSCGASAGIAAAEPWIARHLPGPRVCTEPLAVSVAAQIGVLPVLLIAFDDVAVVTPLTNLLAAPAAEALGVYGFVASAIAGLEPRLGTLVHQPTALLVRWVTVVARAGASFPIHLDRRGAIGCAVIIALVASIACARARPTVAVSKPSPR